MIKKKHLYKIKLLSFNVKKLKNNFSKKINLKNKINCFI